MTTETQDLPEIGQAGQAAARQAEQVRARHGAPTADADLAPPVPAPTVGLSGTRLEMAKIHNQYGRYLAQKAGEIGVDVEAAAAVLRVESGGRAFSEVGGRQRPIIRFENHVFFGNFTNGGRDQARLRIFSRHFQFDPHRRWLGHQFRASDTDQWRPCHQNQAGEYEVFEFAKTLDSAAALKSMSMGLGQIMGFNAHEAGYESAQAMFDAFSSARRGQLDGFFTFVQKHNRGRCLKALQGKDYSGFALNYNGSGQVAKYGALISQAADAYGGVASRLADDPADGGPAGMPHPAPASRTRPGAGDTGRSGAHAAMAAGIENASRAFTAAPSGSTPPTGTRAQLAAQVLANPHIRLAGRHVSAVRDAAFATTEMADTASGHAAKRSRYQNAPGGEVGLDPRMLAGMLALARDYAFTVTEVAGGSHSANSRHYAGIAFDVGAINGVPVSAHSPNFKVFMAQARRLGATEVLGPGVKGHDTHVHVGWPRAAAHGRHTGAPASRPEQFTAQVRSHSQRQGAAGAAFPAAPSPILTHKAQFQEVAAAAARAGDPHPDVTAAQWALESSWGKKVTGTFNYFGQKARAGEPGSAHATHEQVGGRMAPANARFRDYASLDESVGDHVRRWNSREYASAKTDAEAIAALQQHHYATDGKYSDKLLPIIRQYGGEAGSSSPARPSREAARPGGGRPHPLVRPSAAPHGGRDAHPGLRTAPWLQDLHWQIGSPHGQIGSPRQAPLVAPRFVPPTSGAPRSTPQTAGPAAQTVRALAGSAVGGAPRMASRAAKSVGGFLGGALGIQFSGQGGHPEVDAAGLLHGLRQQSSGFAPGSDLRASLGAHLGFDPAGARLHTGPAAAHAARSLHAEAFTIGKDVFFGEGRFDPSSRKGLGLIAHELTHVGQQTGTTGDRARFFTARGGDEMEREAQGVGERVLANAGRSQGVSVGLYDRRYESDGEDELAPSDQQRLDMISLMALTEAENLLWQRGIRGRKTLGVLDIDVSLDLSRMSNPEAAHVWADAIAAAVEAASLDAVPLSKPIFNDAPVSATVPQMPPSPPSVQRHPTPPAKPSAGTPIMRYGFVYGAAVIRAGGLNVHTDHHPQSDIFAKLPDTTRIFITAEFPEGWYQTSVNGRTGYVTKSYVDLLPPGLDAATQLYYIGGKGKNHLNRTTALGIAEAIYGSGIQPGRDGRFYTNALMYVNQHFHKAGVQDKDLALYYQPQPGMPSRYDSANQEAWKSVQAHADSYLWAPSADFLHRLRGVSHESITDGAWAKTTHALGEAWQNAQAFGAGLAQGVGANLGKELNTPQHRAQLEKRLLNDFQNPLFSPAFTAGTVVGLGEMVVNVFKQAWQTLKTAYGIVLDPADALQTATETAEGLWQLFESLFTAQGRSIASQMGLSLGKGLSDPIQKLLADPSPTHFAFELGKQAGPALVTTVLSFLGLPELAGALAAERLALIAEELLPLLERFPALKKVFQTLKTVKKQVDAAKGKAAALKDKIAKWGKKGKGTKEDKGKGIKEDKSPRLPDPLAPLAKLGKGSPAQLRRLMATGKVKSEAELETLLKNRKVQSAVQLRSLLAAPQVQDAEQIQRLLRMRKVADAGELQELLRSRKKVPRLDQLETLLKRPGVDGAYLKRLLPLVDDVGQMQRLTTTVTDAAMLEKLLHKTGKGGRLEQELTTLSAKITSKTQLRSLLKDVEDAPLLNHLLDKLGKPVVTGLAPSLKGTGLHDLEQLKMFGPTVLDPAKRTLVNGGQGAAARALPPLSHLKAARIRTLLKDTGFTFKKRERGMSIWTHTDGSVVRIKYNSPALTAFRPTENLVKEISTTPGAYGNKDIFAKVADSGVIVPQGRKFSQATLEQWFRRRTGRAANQAETDAMMEVWGNASHIDIKR